MRNIKTIIVLAAAVLVLAVSSLSISAENGYSDADNGCIKSWAICTVGTVKYVAVSFSAGSKADYAFEIDGTTVTGAFTDVTTEGAVVKYELQNDQKTLIITKKSDNTKAVLKLS